MRPVYSYPTLLGDVDLKVAAVTVDGHPLPYSMVSTTEHAVALHESGRTVWETARLELKAILPDREISEGQWTDVVCLAVLTEKATNARTTQQLIPGNGGTWTGTLEMSRSRYARRGSLSLVVTATVGEVPGRVIGGTERDWFVDVAASKPMRQRDVDVVDEDFRDGPEWLREFKDSPWIVDTSGDVPRVYLNTTAVEGLVDILNGSAGSLEERLVRDLAASQIAQDAWTAMFHSAVSGLEVDEDGTPVMPDGWRESVLRTMLPDVIPDRQPADALYEIARRRADGIGWSEIQTRIQYAAGRRSQLTRKFTTAVRSAHQKGE
ncbi:hypothetical protein [Rhodococcus rhodochrous]|uniref:Uncharacterized protein n=1 Tax=Rhodococcus rhodochrous KG-21 TaxID=1441923 RepID=A0A0M8PN94_RHORH|nr:hypothetical protein [Rhodococcus rhodochrous]KOS56162.1 hypothetical protein Z051_11170 [Rhodococcus rhodochrous KG-21]